MEQFVTMEHLTICTKKTPQEPKKISEEFSDSQHFLPRIVFNKYAISISPVSLEQGLIQNLANGTKNNPKK